MNDRSVTTINAHDVHVFAIGCRCRQPNLVSPNDRRRPTPVVNRRFPLHAGVVDMEWQICIIGPTVPVRAAILGPVFASHERCRRQHGHHNENESV
jgi:hypothetical protein